MIGVTGSSTIKVIRLKMIDCIILNGINIEFLATNI